MIEYKTIKDRVIENFEFEVNRHIRLGWTPQGGMVVSSGDWFYQAMIKIPAPAYTGPK